MGYGKREAQHLVSYPNGAVVPFNPNHHVGVYTGAYGVIPHYGKRVALVHHPNGAVVPHNPALEVATAQHLASKGYAGAYLGYPYIGRKKREAAVPVNLVTGAAHVPHVVHPYFGGIGYAVAPVVSPFTLHANGALVPKEPEDVIKAREDHLAEHSRKKREAAVPVNLVTGAAHVPHVVHPYFGGIGY